MKIQALFVAMAVASSLFAKGEVQRAYWGPFLVATTDGKVVEAKVDYEISNDGQYHLRWTAGATERVGSISAARVEKALYKLGVHAAERGNSWEVERSTGGWSQATFHALVLHDQGTHPFPNAPELAFGFTDFKPIAKSPLGSPLGEVEYETFMKVLDADSMKYSDAQPIPTLPSHQLIGMDFGFIDGNPLVLPIYVIHRFRDSRNIRMVQWIRPDQKTLYEKRGVVPELEIYQSPRSIVRRLSHQTHKDAFERALHLHAQGKLAEVLNHQPRAIRALTPSCPHRLTE